MNQADYNELVFLEKCRAELRKMGFHKIHPLNEDPLPRARPAAPRTHYLEYNPRTGEYTPVPIIPQYEHPEAQR
jgi:hypothetical protein